MTKYIAKQSVGHFGLGDEVTGLTEKRAKELLEGGAIEAVEDTKSDDKEPAKTTNRKTTAKTEDK